MARPRIQIDQAQFENLCGIQCTEIELALYFRCSVDTIDRWCRRTYHKSFAEVSKEKRELGKISLRRIQWHLAEHSTPMAIFLGKNYLGQSDAREQKVELSATDAEKSKLTDILSQISDD